MDRIDRYIKDVMKRIYASREEKERFEADLREHVSALRESGEPDHEILLRMGTPEDVAHEFMERFPLQYAAFWERLLAFVADISFCYLVSIPIIYLWMPVSGIYFNPFNMVMLGHAFETHVDTAFFGPMSFIRIFATIFIMLALTGVYLLYFPVLETLFGQTIGKKLMRIRVLKETGNPIHFWDAVIRRLSMYFEIILIDGLFALFTEKKQRAFDMVAKTVVIQESGDRSRPINYIIVALMILIPIVFFGTLLIISIPSIELSSVPDSYRF